MGGEELVGAAAGDGDDTATGAAVAAIDGADGVHDGGEGVGEKDDGSTLAEAEGDCGRGAAGDDMAQGFARQKTAVETGHFPLFRYDPSRSAKGFSALELDSKPPSKSFAATASEENRFKLLLKRNPEHAVEMLSKAESFYRNYYDRLEDLTTCNW